MLPKHLCLKNNAMQNRYCAARKLLLLFVCVLAFAVSYTQAAKKHFRVVGYLMARHNGLAKAAQLNFAALTHLNLAFINPDSAGNFALADDLPQIVQLAHNNHVKVLMSFGGGDTPPYLTSFLTDNKRPGFIQKLVGIAVKYGFDGIDVDLEGEAVNANYSKFVTELAAQLAARHKLITAAVATWFAKSVTDSALAKFDFINIMSYDKTGPWEPSRPGQHAPYNMAVEDIDYWAVTRGVARDKLNLGLPFYGYGFGAGNVTSDMNYRDIVSAYPGAENKDSLKLANGQTMYYNGLPTIKSKTKLALQKTGGVMIWEVSQDAAGGLSLLKGIKDVADGN